MGQDSATAITFAQVQKLVKRGGDSKLVAAVDRLAGVGLLVFGVAVDPGALSLLGAKNEVSKLGQGVARKLLGRGDGGFLERARRMAAANYLITFTAFFDALEAQLPGFLAEVALTDAEKIVLVNTAATERFAVPLPHPADPAPSWNERCIFHNLLGGQFRLFAQALLVDSRVPGARERELAAGIQRATVAAEEVYQAQLLHLMVDSPEFCAWTVRRDQARTELIDLGLRALAATVEAMTPVARGHRVAAALSAEYADKLSAPVFGDGARDGLTYPAKADSFVPQAFKVLCGGNGTRLEHEPSWASAPARQDLGEFLLRYLAAPHSTERPLLVLGHPGSGKSLLTEVLAARLAAPAFTVVRVELRDIDPERDLQDQLEIQLKRDTGLTQPWAEFAESRVDSPPLVILDGYDELLQANGKVFADYLSRVHRFQEREARHGRPVRVLVTSRITLIDKAAVPPEATVLRLLEFDAPRRAAWTRVWNEHNARPFTLPDSPALLELAEQPLLLLMLAIYDATVQPLADATGLDRTQLYHSIITEFVRRERAKDPADRCAEDLSTMVDDDVRCLGVAAIGMANRHAVHIAAGDLDADLAYFKRSRTIPGGPGRRLSQSELLVGSFFFIHESRGRVEDAKAYEFLHNTFGEFLAADFLLDQVIRETATVRSLGGDLNRVRLSADWFTCLSHAPLHTRPMLLQLLREWARHRITPAEIEALDAIVHHQLHGVLFSPDPFLPTPDGSPLPRKPLMEHLALYSLNLVLLRAVLSDGEYTLRENEIGPPDSCYRSWDRLTGLWRSWFSWETLSAIAGIQIATRDGATITLRLQEEFRTPPSLDRLHTVYNAASALADHVTVGLAGIPIVEADPERRLLDYTEESLKKEGIDLSGRFTVMRARSEPDLLTASDWFGNEISYGIRRPPEHVYAALPLLRETHEAFPSSSVHILTESILSVSRPEAAAIIDFCTWADPASLDWLVEHYGADSIARSILAGKPYAAPLLHAYAARATTRKYIEVLKRLATLSGQVPRTLDTKTAVALARFADAGQATELCHWALTDLPGPLFTLPLDDISELARLLVDRVLRSMTGIRATIANRFAAEWTDLHALSGYNPETLPRLAQIARITGPGHGCTEQLLQQVAALLRGHQRGRRPWQLNLLVLRAVRENTRVPGARQVLTSLLPDSGELFAQLGLLPFHLHQDELSLREIRDLVWVATARDDQAAQEILVKSLQGYGLR
ncbi:NACHT domain-containing protein [Crossiella sp. CA198]|uniref:NACHT domain-containing protein n=1 Tax=Crossiella sp. CA198 TaxID=3455607 RepID=UPI003F8D6F57